MKFPDPQKEICLWMVPSGDGKVKKLRVSLRRLVCFGLLTVSLTCGLLYMAGNYTRVQVLWSQSLEVLNSVTRERNFLMVNKSQLKEEIASLKEQQQQALEFQNEVLRRIDELRSVLDTASKDGIVPELAGEYNLLDDGEEKEIGGAEIDCEDASCVRARPNLEFTRLNPSDSLQRTSEKLVSHLDETIALVRSIPLGYPGNGHINSHYGPRRSPFSGRLRMHQGIDLALPTGSSIRTTADGVVHSVKRTRTYGLVIDIEHGPRVITRYAHLSEAMVSKGEKVCQGQIIGLTGSTGASTGPHLHYEIRVDGEPVDPVGLIEAAASLRRMVDLEFSSLH